MNTHHNAQCLDCEKGFEANGRELLCHDCFFWECYWRGAWPTQATAKQKRILARGVPKREGSRRTAAELARIAEQKAANPAMTHNFGAVCPDTDEYALEQMRFHAKMVESGRVSGKPICDCGAKKTGTTHANWCSTKR